MKVLFHELGKFKKELILIVLASIVTCVASMFIPYIMQSLIDIALPQKDYELIIDVAGKMIIAVVVIIVFGIIGSRLSSYVAMGVAKNMRSEAFRQVQTFSQAQIDTFTTSSLISRSNTDINQVQLFLSTCLRVAILGPIMSLVGIVMSLKTSVHLSLVLLVAIPVMVIIVVLLGAKAIPLSDVIQQKLDRINMIIRETLTGVRVIRAFGTVDFENKKFQKVNLAYSKSNKQLQILLNDLRPVAEVVLGLTIVGLMVLAYFNSINGVEIYTTGSIMAIIQYIMLIMVAIMYVTVVFLLLPKTITCAKRAEEVIESESEILEPKTPVAIPAQKGYVEFKNVSFTYKGAEYPAIKNLTFKSAPGETTAIIGGTGMGKSTIVNLIPRLYDSTEGEILIDNVNIKNYSLHDLRKKIGMVPQKAVLFKGTIDSNFDFGDDNPTDERKETAAKISQSYDFIMSKPKGFDSNVAQGGTNFSGGQKQRLCIARAIVRKPEIYIFDDSFSALDLKTDRTLRTALKKETGSDATTIIVAQRVSTIMEADRIIVVDKGEVVGIGTHKELLKNCTVYKEICASQMSEEEMNR